MIFIIPSTGFTLIKWQIKLKDFYHHFKRRKVKHAIHHGECENAEDNLFCSQRILNVHNLTSF